VEFQEPELELVEFLELELELELEPEPAGILPC
jgi:hypothetical protein